MIFALMLLIIGVVIVVLSKKSLYKKKMEYERGQQQLFDRMQVQENSKNNSDGTDERYEEVFHENKMNNEKRIISHARNESHIDSAIEIDEKKENQKNEPVDILKMRLAKGEITVEEFDKIPPWFFHAGGLSNSPLGILKKRYATGEITLDEFNKIEENIRDHTKDN